jgi:hypothetical protein
MASPISAKRNLAWLEGQGIAVPEDNIYMAPIYGSGSISDTALLERLNRLRPRHVIMTIGGGTQERLGLYLKRNLDYRPAIHCIGAAIAFLSGDQVHIPVWADKFYLGWLFRSPHASPPRPPPRLQVLIPDSGQPKNKLEKVGVFLAVENHHTNNHIHHAFHHKLTTFLPPQNTTKSQNPLQKPPFPPPKYFSPKQALTSPFRHQSR